MSVRLWAAGAVAVLTSPMAAWATQVPAATELIAAVTDDEFIGPFASWVDVKADFGAAGDGVADDTVAIQKGLDALRRIDSKQGPAALYFPAGRYRITQTLRMRLKSGANLIGADPMRTTIVWDGPGDGTMLLTSGSFDTLFERLTWDGRKSAGVGIAQWWNFTLDRANYQGSIKHVDEVFRNLGIGIQGGRLGKDYGQGDSEVLIKRVRFANMSKAGVDVGSFNALNWWIWDSEFTDCARGVSNDFSVDDRGPTNGAGNFAIYRSVFLRSGVADVSIGNTGWFSMHANVSIGSRKFFRAGEIGPNSASIVLQDNRVVDTLDPVSILVGNEGPIVLLDNHIRSRAGTSGPVVELVGSGLGPGHADRDVISIGNRFTRSNAVSNPGAGGRTIVLEDRVVDPLTIADDIPLLPGVAADRHRRIFEVPEGASARRIQAVIDRAAASGADNAVVHIPPGRFDIDRTIVVPAQRPVQIAGDGDTSTLWWTGSDPHGTILRLAGPSHATVRELKLIGGQATGIEIAAADQPGGRVFIEGSMLGELRLAGLAQTRLIGQANTEFAAVIAERSASVLSLGCGGFGPVEVRGNSRVLVADSWYEGDRAEVFRGDSGEFTYLNGLIAPYAHGVRAGHRADAPAFLLDRFAGRVSVIGAQLALRDGRNGIDLQAMDGDATALFLGLWVHYLAGGQGDDEFIRMPEPSSGKAPAGGVVAPKIYAAGLGARDMGDLGRADAAFLLAGLEPARSVRWRLDLPAPGGGVTDVRVYRVIAPDTAVGIFAHE